MPQALKCNSECAAHLHLSHSCSRGLALPDELRMDGGQGGLRRRSRGSSPAHTTRPRSLYIKGWDPKAIWRTHQVLGNNETNVASRRPRNQRPWEYSFGGSEIPKLMCEVGLRAASCMPSPAACAYFRRCARSRRCRIRRTEVQVPRRRAGRRELWASSSEAQLSLPTPNTTYNLLYMTFEYNCLLGSFHVRRITGLNSTESKGTKIYNFKVYSDWAVIEVNVYSGKECWSSSCVVKDKLNLAHDSKNAFTYHLVLKEQSHREGHRRPPFMFQQVLKVAHLPSGTEVHVSTGLEGWTVPVKDPSLREGRALEGGPYGVYGVNAVRILYRLDLHEGPGMNEKYKGEKRVQSTQCWP
ncbi:hypothetical protein C8F04DRAFT_1178429 [Mycena alexandri]|uniref:Uncharacterized protein n=1 Tax=Mycena alexandri TaxID=1745969 RepID=A0AAD6X808_9AGAR|nr:hypothetical protein C8F04DRAFT_1178429 [Mycena alexandri]